MADIGCHSGGSHDIIERKVADQGRNLQGIERHMTLAAGACNDNMQAKSNCNMLVTVMSDHASDMNQTTALCARACLIVHAPCT